MFKTLNTIIILPMMIFFLLSSCESCRLGKTDVIKVGLLFSLTGTMAISEQAVRDATLMAIDELNSQGGLLGKKIEPVVVDTESRWSHAAEMAEKLIVEDKVVVVFGCWTSACRKMVKPVFEKHNSLLFYPVQYEGLEQSPNIIYTGAAPNQQIIPAVKWAFDNLGKTFFLVGSDYIFPRTANEIIKEQVKALGGKIVGEEYIILGDKNVTKAVEKIIFTKPSVILNTVNGDSNISLFKELRNKGITPDKIPTISFSLSEEELGKLDIKTMVGDYGAWNYLQSVDTPENKKFVTDFKKRYGQDRAIGDPMEAAYFSVFLWAQAVKEAKSAAPDKVARFIKRQSFNAPEGLVYIDPENNHTWKSVRIGEIGPDGQYKIIWSSEKAIRPIPYPSYRTLSEWNKFQESLYSGWEGHWENPGVKNSAQQ